PSSRFSFCAAKSKRAACASHGLLSCSRETVFIVISVGLPFRLAGAGMVSGVGGQNLSSIGKQVEREQGVLFGVGSFGTGIHFHLGALLNWNHFEVVVRSGAPVVKVSGSLTLRIPVGHLNLHCPD